MKNIYSLISAIRLPHKIAIVLTVLILGTAIGPPLQAQPLNFNFSLPNQQILPSLSAPTNSQRFFEEGRCQCEREVENLINRDYYPSEDLLKIDPEALTPESLSSLENPQLVLDTNPELE